MRYIIITFFLLTTITDIYSSNKYKSEFITSENTPVIVDTLEFVDFWDNFRCAILSRDTVLLVSVVEEEVVGNWIFLQSDFHEIDNSCFMFSNKSKYQSIKLFEILFSCPYITLLEKCNIKKDLYSEKTTFVKDCRCEIFTENRRYRADVDFNVDHTITYNMVFSIDTEYSTYSINFKLRFRKKDEKTIKLYKIDYNEITIMT
jgi:hypothetical protein